MAGITNIETGHYRIPLPVTLSDSTHGEITAFELITVRLRDADPSIPAGRVRQDRALVLADAAAAAKLETH